jgi:hypothetical protein
MNEAHGHDEASGVKRRRYVPDCGTSTHKFLSYAAAIQTRKFYRPGRESAGERRSYAVCEDFGAHQPRCLQRCGLVVERRPLVRYGLGVDLYFKGLKVVILAFLVLSALAAPSIVAFHTGARETAAERDARLSYDPLKVLFYNTLGAWGESAHVCGDVAEGGVLALECPAGTEIVDVFAYYGAPSGFCTCPEDHQVGSDGTCPGDVKSADACEDERPCFAGATDLGDTCCARGVKGDAPDLDADVNPRPNATCDSHTAPFIVQGLCLGAENCTLPVDFDARFRWTPRGDRVPTKLQNSLAPSNRSRFG